MRGGGLPADGEGGGGVEDSLLVLFHKERLVLSLLENHYGERSVAHGLQYACGAC